MTTQTTYPPLPQPPEPVMPEAKPGRSCPGCRSADSWGMPDCPGQGAGCFPTADAVQKCCVEREQDLMRFMRIENGCLITD